MAKKAYKIMATLENEKPIHSAKIGEKIELARANSKGVAWIIKEALKTTYADWKLTVE